MKAIAALLLLVVSGACTAKSFAPDFSTTAGFDRTCASLHPSDARQLTDDRERIARFIQPGNWQIDFDGNGHVSLFEKYLFWVPKRDVEGRLFDAPPSEDGYRSRYVNPVISVDQSDVYWAIAYLDFAEAALNFALAYDWDPAKYQEATLVSPGRIAKIAYARMQEGIGYSMRMRESLLQERHDRQEWIPNPHQVNTASPLQMDAQTFATWGTLLQELDAPLRGKTLLGGHVDSGERQSGPRDLAFGFCAAGEGLDVRSLFTQPVSRLFDARQLAARCVKPTPARPLSGLAPLISASFRRNAATAGATGSGEWTILRHLTG